MDVSPKPALKKPNSRRLSADHKAIFGAPNEELTNDDNEDSKLSQLAKKARPTGQTARQPTRTPEDEETVLSISRLKGRRVLDSDDEENLAASRQDKKPRKPAKLDPDSDVEAIEHLPERILDQKPRKAPDDGVGVKTRSAGNKKISAALKEVSGGRAAPKVSSADTAGSDGVPSTISKRLPDKPNTMQPEDLEEDIGVSTKSKGAKLDHGAAPKQPSESKQCQ